MMDHSSSVVGVLLIIFKVLFVSAGPYLPAALVSRKLFVLVTALLLLLHDLVRLVGGRDVDHPQIIIPIQRLQRSDAPEGALPVFIVISHL
jgi:hypothetical protein